MNRKLKAILLGMLISICAVFGVACKEKEIDYTKDELQELSKRFALDSNVEITDEAAVEVANQAEGSYRKLTTIMKRSRDFSMIKGDRVIDLDIVKQVFETL